MKFVKLLTIISLLAQVFLAKSQELSLPYKSAGWTDQEAAAHLLNRLAYGPKHGQVNDLLGQLEVWALGQLNAANDVKALNQQLQDKYSALSLDLEEIGQTYPAPGVRLIFMALQRGQNANQRGTNKSSESYMQRGRGMSIMSADSSRSNGQNDLLQRILNAEENTNERYKRFNRLTEYRFDWQPFEVLFYQLMAQKIERAIYSPNQLEEVMVDFWFNHFNVSIHGVNDMASQVLSYERDAIRPHALGKFRDLLGATAKHPAMLIYLDNHRSNADEGATTLSNSNTQREKMMQDRLDQNPSLKQFAQQPGVNENYARELLELHTMGVDGGYTQQDVEEVARAFTGWKASPLIYPVPEQMAKVLKKQIKGTLNAVLAHGFYFDPTRHDAEEKVILGEKFVPGGGVEEGERILDIVAKHPSTAAFIARKLAIRFVSDHPPQSLIDKLTTKFLASGGDIKSVLETLITSEEFWDKQYQADKIKTPLEYLVSSLRTTDAEVKDYRKLIRWCTQMGQPLYAYQSPTGYPENNEFWTNGAALLNRMNFANELAQMEMEGVSLDLLNLNNKREPESDQEALSTYLKILNPGRNIRETQELLLPILADPNFDQKLKEKTKTEKHEITERETKAMTKSQSSNDLGQIVGLILGSPEFQRQ
ncbi:MAG: DUF1800 domain-containing protein [Bacteroidota bacterium]